MLFIAIKTIACIGAWEAKIAFAGPETLFLLKLKSGAIGKRPNLATHPIQPYLSDPDKWAILATQPVRYAERAIETGNGEIRAIRRPPLPGNGVSISRKRN